MFAKNKSQKYTHLLFLKYKFHLEFSFFHNFSTCSQIICDHEKHNFMKCSYFQKMAIYFLDIIKSRVNKRGDASIFGTMAFFLAAGTFPVSYLFCKSFSYHLEPFCELHDKMTMHELQTDVSKESLFRIFYATFFFFSLCCSIIRTSKFGGCWYVHNVL